MAGQPQAGAHAPALGQPAPQPGVGADGAGAAVAQLQAQIAALQAQLNQLAVAPPQPVQAPAVQHVNPNTIAISTPFTSGDIVEWLDRYVECADANGWNEDQRL